MKLYLRYLGHSTASPILYYSESSHMIQEKNISMYMQKEKNQAVQLNMSLGIPRDADLATIVSCTLLIFSWQAALKLRVANICKAGLLCVAIMDIKSSARASPQENEINHVSI